jgi:hypothetical protein
MEETRLREGITETCHREFVWRMLKIGGGDQILLTGSWPETAATACFFFLLFWVIEED